jgi:hypothetical protein
VLGRAHTGIFTSLTREGRPISLPVWFVTRDRSVWLSTPAKAKKVARVRRNPVSAFLVESGRRWAELAAVHLSCRAEVIGDPDVVAWVDGAKEDKYRAFRTAHAAMPTGTRAYYEADRVAIRLDVTGKILSWDNARIETAD